MNYNKGRRRIIMPEAIEEIRLFDGGESKVFVTFSSININPRSALISFSPRTTFNSWPEEVGCRDRSEYRVFVIRESISLVADYWGIEPWKIKGEFNKLASFVKVMPGDVRATFAEMKDSMINQPAA